jgi:hypothetical protein
MLEGHLGELQMDSDGLQYRDFYKVRHMGVCILAPPFREHSVSVLLPLLTLCWSIIPVYRCFCWTKRSQIGNPS